MLRLLTPRKNAALAVAAVALTALLAMGGCSGASDAPPGADGTPSRRGSVPGRGDPAPGFQARLLTGAQVELEALRGRPMVLNFWATTCAPCIREMPALAAAARDHTAEGLVIVGLNYGEPERSVRKFVEAFTPELGFPIALDLMGEVGRAYGVAVLPTTYFVDRDGVVQYRRIGELKAQHLAEGLSRIF